MTMTEAQFAEFFGAKDAGAGVEITKTFVALLAGNWPMIRRMAEDPECGGLAKVSMGMNLNFTGKTPCGSLTISYALRRTDDAEFHVEDPDQRKLPLEKEAIAVQFGPGNSHGDPVVLDVAAGLNRMADTMPEGQSVTISAEGKKLVKIDGRKKGGAK